MAAIEETELERHRGAIAADVERLVEKYRAIFDWDAPDIDQHNADRLILAEIQTALDNVEKKLLG